MSNVLSKVDLAKILADKANLSQTQAVESVNILLDAIISNVSKGNKIQLIGFGTFERKHRAATVSRNPKTGEPVQVAAKNLPKFKAGKKFKDAVSG